MNPVMTPVSPSSELWLLIDVGNTHTVAAITPAPGSEPPRSGMRLMAQARFRTDSSVTSDEYRAQLRTLFGEAQPLLARLTRVILSSVVPPLDPVIERAFHPLPVLSLKHLLVRDFELDLPQPGQLGADRLANVAGALAISAPPFVIVDAGTATTFCVIDSRPAYIGGAIVPGMETSWRALQARAAKLFSVELLQPPSSLGRDTETQLRSGVLLGTEALIEGLTDRLIADARTQTRFESPTLIATGGCIHGLKLSSRFRWEPDLTLIGLLRYGQLNPL
jgi:type III pantothenate kinase